MKMTLKKTASAVLISFCLAACSSGGSGGDNPSTKPNNQNPNNQTQPQENSGKKDNSKSVAPKFNHDRKDMPKHSLSELSNKSEVELVGYRVPDNKISISGDVKDKILTTKGEGKYENQVLDGKAYTLYSFTNTYSNHSLLKNNNDGEVIAVYAGTPTKANEKSKLTGEATYNGKAYVAGQGVGKIDGQVTLTANFSNNNITGNITAPNTNITLKDGRLTNTENNLFFIGVADGSFQGKQYVGDYSGSFMGEKANEAAGRVLLTHTETQSTLQASFSAVKAE